MSYGNQDGASPQDSPAAAESTRGTTVVAEQAEPAAVPVDAEPTAAESTAAEPEVTPTDEVAAGSVPAAESVPESDELASAGSVDADPELKPHGEDLWESVETEDADYSEPVTPPAIGTASVPPPAKPVVDPPPVRTVTVPQTRGPIGGRSRPSVLLGGAAAVLLVFGLVMTGLFVFKSNQETETSAKLATAQSALAARDAKVKDVQKQLTAVQIQLKDAQSQLNGAQQTAASSKTNQATVKQCLTLIQSALAIAKTGSSNQLDQALKKLKAPCAKAVKLA